MTTASLLASLEHLTAMYDDLLRLLEEVDDAAVKWVPPSADANAISGIVRHTLGSTAAWLARAAGEEIPRDREGELRARDTAVELKTAVARASQDVSRQFARLESLDLATPRSYRSSTASGSAPREVSAAWCVQHAVTHAGEHWGQVQLTRQWYAARS